MVIEGIRVGEGAVVAAGAVVVEDVPANTVVAGCPCTCDKNERTRKQRARQLWLSALAIELHARRLQKSTGFYHQHFPAYIQKNWAEKKKILGFYYSPNLGHARAGIFIRLMVIFQRLAYAGWY